MTSDIHNPHPQSTSKTHARGTWSSMPARARRTAIATATIMTLAASLAHSSDAYHPSRIGTPGKPWGVDEYKTWRETRPKQRDYSDLVARVRALGETRCARTDARPFEVVKYGDLGHDFDATDPSKKSSFPLYAVRSVDWSPAKPNIFITGGVHGYETSGVEGALLFVTGGKAVHYSQHFNFLIGEFCL